MKFIKKIAEDQYKVYDYRYQTFFDLGIDTASYELTETDEIITGDKLCFQEQNSFSETWCGNPEKGPAIKYGKEKNYDFILWGDERSERGRVFTKIHTNASYFNRRQ